VTADDEIVVWDVASGKPNWTFEEHSRPESQWSRVAWSPNGERIASTGYDGVIKVSSSSHAYGDPPKSLDHYLKLFENEYDERST